MEVPLALHVYILILIPFLVGLISNMILTLLPPTCQNTFPPRLCWLGWRGEGKKINEGKLEGNMFFPLFGWGEKKEGKENGLGDFLPKPTNFNPPKSGGKWEGKHGEP